MNARCTSWNVFFLFCEEWSSAQRIRIDANPIPRQAVSLQSKRQRNTQKGPSHNTIVISQRYCFGVRTTAKVVRSFHGLHHALRNNPTANNFATDAPRHNFGRAAENFIFLPRNLMFKINGRGVVSVIHTVLPASDSAFKEARRTFLPPKRKLRNYVAYSFTITNKKKKRKVNSNERDICVGHKEKRKQVTTLYITPVCLGNNVLSATKTTKFQKKEGPRRLSCCPHRNMSNTPFSSPLYSIVHFKSMVDVKIKLHAKPTYVPCTRTCIYLTIRYTQIIYLCNIQPNKTVLTKKKYLEIFGTKRSYTKRKMHHSTIGSLGTGTHRQQKNS